MAYGWTLEFLTLTNNRNMRRKMLKNFIPILDQHTFGSAYFFYLVTP